MKLKHVELRTVIDANAIANRMVESRTRILLAKKTQTEVSEFRAFDQELEKSRLSPNTKNSYRQCVLKFIDYLFAAGIVHARERCSLHYVHEVVFGYRGYLVNEPDSEVVNALINDLKDHKPNLGANSANLHLNAVEFYLGISERIASATHTRDCRQLGISPSNMEYQPLFEGVWGSNSWSNSEKLKWQQNTMIGGVVGAHKFRRINSRIFERFDKIDSKNRERLRMSQEQVSAVIDHPSLSLRDRLLFAFVHASGMRISECLLLQFRHVDFVNQRIFMTEDIDTAGLTVEELRICRAWKGRDTAKNEVFLFGYAEEVFWATLDEYLRSKEFVSDHTHTFIFTFVKGARKGRPLILVNSADINCRSLSNLEKKYKTVLKDVGAVVYGFHLARHVLVNYLYYEIPRIKKLPSGESEMTVGLNPQTVRGLIGHVSVNSTFAYSRSDAEEALAEHYKARRHLSVNAPAAIQAIMAEKDHHLIEARRLEKKIETLALSSKGVIGHDV